MTVYKMNSIGGGVKLVIVEGAKGSGKSTFCCQLANWYPGSLVVHFPRDGTETGDRARKALVEGDAACQDYMLRDIDDFLNNLDAICSGVSGLVIMDRSFISNIVYRDGDMVVCDRFLDILEDARVMTVILWSDLAKLQERLTRRSELEGRTSLPGELSGLFRSNGRFAQFAYKLGFRSIKYDNLYIRPGMWITET
jgi:thymidylate kinase